MSEIAGSAVMLIAGQYLSNANDGKGVLVGASAAYRQQSDHRRRDRGEYAARTALAMGASVKHLTMTFTA
jgi:alanine dehydrogenase